MWIPLGGRGVLSPRLESQGSGCLAGEGAVSQALAEEEQDGSQCSRHSRDLASIGLVICFLTWPVPRKAWVCLTEPTRVGSPLLSKWS